MLGKKINLDGIRKIMKGLIGGTTGNEITCLFIIPDREAPLNCAHVGISSIASYIHEYGRFNSHGINTCLFSDAEIKELIQKNRYEYVFITMITGQHEHVISISKLIKSIDPKIKIVIGGPHIAITKCEMLEKSSDIDYLIVGEGEKTALELLEKSPLAGIKGLIFRNANGVIIENPERPFTEDLDEFPAPKLDIYLRTNWLEYPIITSRGCVYKCNFCCSSKIWKHKLRFRSIESIEKEVFQIIKIMGKNDYIIISDDFFNFKKERTLKLCDIFKKFGIKYFVRGIRADKVDSDIAKALKDSGCIGCGVGVESVDNSSLKMMNKNVRFDEIERGCKFLMENGIIICGQFIIGNIGDTLETVKKSIEFGKKINVASFYPLYVLPGTELEDYVNKNKLLLPKPYKVDGLKGKKKEAYIFFETEIFPLADRIKAMHLADDAGFLT